jgi:hypothetical protein
VAIQLNVFYYGARNRQPVLFGAIEHETKKELRAVVVANVGGEHPIGIERIEDASHNNNEEIVAPVRKNPAGRRDKIWESASYRNNDGIDVFHEAIYCWPILFFNLDVKQDVGVVDQTDGTVSLFVKGIVVADDHPIPSS